MLLFMIFVIKHALVQNRNAIAIMDKLLNSAPLNPFQTFALVLFFVPGVHVTAFIFIWWFTFYTWHVVGGIVQNFCRSIVRIE